VPHALDVYAGFIDVEDRGVDEPVLRPVDETEVPQKVGRLAPVG
jgi:hypothetical protein